MGKTRSKAQRPMSNVRRPRGVIANRLSSPSIFSLPPPWERVGVRGPDFTLPSIPAHRGRGRVRKWTSTGSNPGIASLKNQLAMTPWLSLRGASATKQSRYESNFLNGVSFHHGDTEERKGLFIPPGVLRVPCVPISIALDATAFFEI